MAAALTGFAEDYRDDNGNSGSTGQIRLTVYTADAGNFGRPVDLPAGTTVNQFFTIEYGSDPEVRKTHTIRISGHAGPVNGDMVLRDGQVLFITSTAPKGGRG